MLWPGHGQQPGAPPRSSMWVPLKSLGTASCLLGYLHLAASDHERPQLRHRHWDRHTGVHHRPQPQAERWPGATTPAMPPGQCPPVMLAEVPWLALSFGRWTAGVGGTLFTWKMTGPRSPTERRGVLGRLPWQQERWTAGLRTGRRSPRGLHHLSRLWGPWRAGKPTCWWLYPGYQGSRGGGARSSDWPPHWAITHGP